MAIASISIDKYIQIKTMPDETVTVYCQVLFDKRLESLDIHVHCLLKYLAERPKWDLTIGGIATILRKHYGTIQRSIAKLKRCGYVETVKTQDERGRWIGWLWTIYPIPRDEYQKRRSTPPN